MASRQREFCATKAKLCEHSERFEDMKAAMEELIKSSEDEPLNDEERNLLSVAYKNVVGARRSSWRMMQAREQDEQDEKQKKLVCEYRMKIEEELNKYCDEVIDLLDTHLLPHPKDDAAEIFFCKMKGDYYRYKVEIAKGANREEFAAMSEAAYKLAMDKATEKLKATHPIRLGLALNFSVFHYEIKNEANEACTLARSAFEEAISELDGVTEGDTYKDSTLIMQLLRDNLTLWTSEIETDQEPQD